MIGWKPIFFQEKNSHKHFLRGREWRSSVKLKYFEYFCVKIFFLVKDFNDVLEIHKLCYFSVVLVKLRSESFQTRVRRSLNFRYDRCVGSGRRRWAHPWRASAGATAAAVALAVLVEAIVRWPDGWGGCPSDCRTSSSPKSVQTKQIVMESVPKSFKVSYVYQIYKKREHFGQFQML